MMQVFIRLNDESLESMLKRTIEATSPAGAAVFLSGVMDPYLKERAKRRFRMEGDEASGPWMPLSETTHAFRESQGFPPDHPINHRTGALERYVTGGSPAAAKPIPGGAMVTFPSRRATGETAAKLRTAQEGKLRPRTPARPVLAFDSTDYAFGHTALETYIKSAAKGTL